MYKTQFKFLVFRFRRIAALFPLILFIYMSFSFIEYLTLKGIAYVPKVETKSCHVGVITTWPPRNCGIAEFSKKFVDGLKDTALFRDNCSLEIIALAVTDGSEYRADSIVTPLIVDRSSPSVAFHQLSKYINTGRFTHVIIEQEFGITWCMWQLFDLARWIYDKVTVITVVHSPKAYPTIEEKDLVFHMSRYSHKMVVMTWYALRSLKYVYGVDPSKVFFIPHGTHPLITSSKEDSEYLKDLKPDDFLILSNGLIHIYKGYDRLLRILPSIIANKPNVYFYIVGRENPHNVNVGMMNRLLRQVRMPQLIFRQKPWEFPRISNGLMNSFLVKSWN